MHALMRQLHLENSRKLQCKLYLAAKNSNTRRFHALYDRIYRDDILWSAWYKVKGNRGGAGVDNVTLKEIMLKGEDVFIRQIRNELLNNSYFPKPVNRVYIPKSGKDKKFRPLGIPTIKDRVVQQACKLIIEPIFEADFLSCSYGFRPCRSAQEAILSVGDSLVRFWWVVDCDIKGFFDNVDQGILLSLLERRISDRRVIKLIRKWLKAGVMIDGAINRSELGTPQGGVISPLLANIYLHELDKRWFEYDFFNILVRYADDLVLLCKYGEHALEAMNMVNETLSGLKLELNEDKSRIVNTAKEGFDFLGFHFHKRISRKSGFLVPYRWPAVKSMKSVRRKIHDITARKNLWKSERMILKELNDVIRGWRNYFAAGNSSTKFRQLDVYVRARLLKWLKGKKRRRIRKWKLIKWIYNCNLERFFIPGNCRKTIRKLEMKVVGKPYEGEPHVRFDAAGDGNRA